MKDSCEAPYHDFVVVNWLVTKTGQQARELLCNHCLCLVDLAMIRESHCKLTLPEAPELTN